MANGQWLAAAGQRRVGPQGVDEAIGAGQVGPGCLLGHGNSTDPRQAPSRILSARHGTVPFVKLDNGAAGSGKKNRARVALLYSFSAADRAVVKLETCCMSHFISRCHEYFSLQMFTTLGSSSKEKQLIILKR